MRGINPLLVGLSVLALAGCAEDPGKAATVSPSPSEAAAGPFAPVVGASPGVPADNSPAGQALAEAARRTSASGAFRVRMTASFQGAAGAPRSTMEGTGESESHTRFHLALVFSSATQKLSTESVSYDGVNYGRSNSLPWHVVSGAGSSGDPRTYLGYLTGATAVRDAGPGTQAGQPAERFEAVVPIRRQSLAPGAPVRPATVGRLVAWVDGATGRLVGEDLTTSVGTPLETDLSIVFSDFGGDIKVVAPVLTP